MAHKKSSRPDPSALGIILGAFGIVVVILTGVAIATAGQNLSVGPDQGWHDLLAAHRVSGVEAIGRFLNIAGGTLVMSLVSIVIVICLLFLRQYRASFSIAVTMALATLISTILKTAIARPRPSDGTVDVTVDVASPAFPSGHATAAAAITIALLIAFPRIWTRVLAAVWIPLVAFSRNYLLVHWLSDVVAGVVLGASVALLVAGITSAFLKKRSRDQAAIMANPQSVPSTMTT